MTVITNVIPSEGDLPSHVISGDEAASTIFPTRLPDPERLVYEFVHGCVFTRIQFPESGNGLTLPLDFDVPPSLDFYKGKAEPTIPVSRGWPAYPGKVPAIGVALGSETEDDALDQMQGGFVGDAEHFVEGECVAVASYYSEPLYATVVVELIHENRDERDRLHNELRRVLFPLRRKLPAMDGLIRKVRVDAEKQELPLDEQPIVIYVSVFTVHVYYEMLEAVDVRGESDLVQAVTPTQTY